MSEANQYFKVTIKKMFQCASIRKLEAKFQKINKEKFSNVG